jgi:acylphosphatase
MAPDHDLPPVSPSDAATFRVEGSVQGVGFRYWALNRARELKLEGYVKNRGDGTVELVATGPRAAVDRMHKLLEEGPPGSSVSRVVRTPITGALFSGFEIRH